MAASLIEYPMSPETRVGIVSSDVLMCQWAWHSWAKGTNTRFVICISGHSEHYPPLWGPWSCVIGIYCLWTPGDLTCSNEDIAGA